MLYNDVVRETLSQATKRPARGLLARTGLLSMTLSDAGWKVMAIGGLKLMPSLDSLTTIAFAESNGLAKVYATESLPNESNARLGFPAVTKF